MDIATLIYLASVSGNLGTIFAVFGTLGFIVSFLTNCIFVAAAYDDRSFKSKPKWWVTILALFAVFVSAFFPSKETIYMMAGAQLVQDIAESPEAARIGDRLVVLIEAKLDEAIAEIPADQAPETPVEEPAS